MLYKSSMDLLSFPGMEKIETFSVESNTLVFPFNDGEVDTILMLENSSTEQYKMILKSISRLDANVKLREIISTGNFDQAKRFATMYKLPQQDIYVAEMQYLITKNHINEKEIQLKILRCVQEIKDFFDFDIFVNLMLITMSSVHSEKFLLTKLMEHTNRHRETEPGKRFYYMIKNELKRFTIFQLMYSEADYSAAQWKSFRNTDNCSILFSAFELCNINTIIEVWRLIQNKMGDLFTTNISVFCQKLIDLGKLMINKRSDEQEFTRLFNWLKSDLIKQQIRKAPEQLEFLIEVINRIMREIEANRDKRYRQMCIKELDEIIGNLSNLDVANPASKARIEAARLFSDLEQVNAVYSLTNLRNELIQLEKLFKNYNLDLSLDVFKNETATQLAMRFLDQVSNTELQGGHIWNKLDNFLLEFNVRHSEFYHGYIYDKLVHKLSSRTENITNDASGEYSMIFFRFSILLDKLHDKQTQLQCLEAFASRADLPLKIQLNVLIDKHIAKNHPSNPVVEKLKHIQRRSRIYPICTRYNYPYNSKSFKPENLISIILRTEIDCDAQSAAQCKADITNIAMEFSLSDIVVVEQRCSILIVDIFQNEYRAYETWSRLATLLIDPKFPNSIRVKLVHSSFSEFYTMLSSICDMNSDTMEYLCEIGSCFASLYSDSHTRSEWLSVFNAIRLCLDTTRGLHDNRIVSVIDLLAGHRVSDMEYERVRMDLVGRCLSEELMSHLTESQTSEARSNGHTGLKSLRDDVCHTIQSWNVFCVRKFETRDDIFMAMVSTQLVSLVHRFIADRDYGVATRAIYCALEVVLEFVGHPTNVSHSSDTISDIIKALVLVDDIGGNIFIICHIIEAYSRLIGLFIFANLKYLCKQFNNLQSLVTFIHSFLVCFASLDRPGDFCDLTKLDKNMYQEKPVSLDCFEHFLVFIRLGLSAISSFDDDFDSALSLFRTSLLSMLPQFLDTELDISGYLSGLSLLIQISNESNIAELYPFISKHDKVCIATCRLMLQKRVVDIDLIVSLMLQCSPKAAQQEITTLIRKCKSRKFLLQLYSIAILVLLRYRNTDVPDRSLIFVTMTKEVHKKLWSMKLADINITLKAGNVQELNATKSELFKHPMISIEFVQEFLIDFQFCDTDNHYEFFRSVFMVSFLDCDDFNGYKSKVEKILCRAEDIWDALPHSAGYMDKSIVCLSSILFSLSPYHYELIEYVYRKLVIYTDYYQNELDILMLLYSWTRVSDIDEYEALFCQSLVTDYGIDYPCDAKYVSAQRLPFHLFLRDEPMKIIAPQLNNTNFLMWHDMYNVIDKVSYKLKTAFNTDKLHEITAKNIVGQFIACNNLTKCPDNKKHVFMGTLYRSSCCWFEKTLSDIEFVLDDLLVNETYVEIMRDFIDHLVIGEQLLTVMKRAISWIDKKMGYGFCNSMRELASWRNQLISNSKCLEIEEIFSKSNFHREECLELIDHGSLLEHILSEERLSMGRMSSGHMGKVIAVLIEIAEKTGIDIHEFACNHAKIHLKLISSFQESFCDNEFDMSILNTSSEISIDDSRQDKDQPDIVDMKEMEILSQNKSIKYSIKESLFQHTRENSLTLDQWNNILQFLFRTFRPCEDDAVNELCTSHWYSLFLVMLELENLKLLKSCPGNDVAGVSGLQAIDNRLREFQLHDKTGLVKQLFGMQTPVGPRQTGLIRDMFDLFPETIDISDPTIALIRGKIVI